MTDIAGTTDETDPTKMWHKTVCILCSLNCGVEVRLDERRITRVRGNKTHVSSKGYTCEKALRLDHYQNSATRLTRPLKRMPDGSYIELDWHTAIAEIAEGLRKVNDTYGTGRILYYGGGGQGNHLGGLYGAATRKALGITRRSNALAQEKTGESWVEGRMYGTHTHGEFEEAELMIFLGKNPWQSHGFDETRRVLKQVAADDDRTMIVIDPRRTETADLADVFLQLRPGTDAYLVAAIGAVLVDERLTATDWLAANTIGTSEAIAALAQVPIADFAVRCGIAEETIRSTTRMIAAARSVSIYEDLGVQMSPNSTLVSYLQRLITTLIGSYGKPGAMNAHTGLVPLLNYGSSGSEPVDPVTGGAVISGLIACNELADGILSDHPDRSRALFIETANPVHSLADSKKFRLAMREVDISVVVDVVMTETAAEADYVLPAASQFEKVEMTFFNLSFPENRATLRAPILDPLDGTLSEPEIHSRLLRELGFITDEDLAPLHEAAAAGYDALADAFIVAAAENPMLATIGAVVLYETLGPTLPDGMAAAAPLWFSAQQLAMRYPDQVRAAGHEGEGAALGTALFEALLAERDGVAITRHEHDNAFDLLRTSDQKINVMIPELIDELAGLVDSDTNYTSAEFPFVLSAGERRSFTANTIMRDPSWRKKDPEGALRLSPADAEALGISAGSRVRISTRGGTAVATAELNDTMLDGHVSLPNGLGVDYSPAGGNPEAVGVAPNELTTSDWRDPIAGTPWHKHVPARLELLES